MLFLMGILFLLAILISVGFYAINRTINKQTYQQSLNETAAYIFSDGGQAQDNTAVASNSINNLKNSDLSKSNIKDDLDVYYNSLYAFYIEANDCSGAFETYAKEVKPKNVLLNDLQILWLMDCPQVDSTDLKSMLNDGIKYLEDAIKTADQEDKEELAARIDILKKREKLWQ